MVGGRENRPRNLLLVLQGVGSLYEQRWFLTNGFSRWFRLFRNMMQEHVNER
jgi:hypothetical protein